MNKEFLRRFYIRKIKTFSIFLKGEKLSFLLSKKIKIFVKDFANSKGAEVVFEEMTIKYLLQIFLSLYSKYFVSFFFLSLNYS